MKETITSEYNGCILKSYVLKKCEISHKLLTHLKAREDGILLNGKRVTVRAILKEGDILELNFEDTEGSGIEAVKTDVMPDILYEDDDLMILNKPPHMPTHPSHNHYTDTLANAVAYIFKERKESIRFRAITRLDRDTSGAVLIAKDPRSAAILSAMMADGKIEKSYVAICEGSAPEKFTVNKPIKREKESIITRVVCNDGEGQAALTHFTKVAEHRGMSLLAVTPITGRTHQIRVHLAYAGHPIVGDELYGTKSDEIDRQALHAHSLTLSFADGRKIHAEAPLFPDMERLLSCNN